MCFPLPLPYLSLQVAPQFLFLISTSLLIQCYSFWRRKLKLAEIELAFVLATALFQFARKDSGTHSSYWDLDRVGDGRVESGQKFQYLSCPRSPVTALLPHWVMRY